MRRKTELAKRAVTKRCMKWDFINIKDQTKKSEITLCLAGCRYLMPCGSDLQLIRHGHAENS